MGVAISGMGVVSAIGVGLSETKAALLSGRSGVGQMRHLASAHAELPVGEVNLSNAELKAALGIDPHKEVSRTALLGAIAAREALKQAALPDKTLGRPLRIAIVSGTTVGGMDISEQHYDDLAQQRDGDYLRQHDCGASTNITAELLDLDFANSVTISTACSSAANALMIGAEMITYGKADIVLAGGSEALSVFHLNGFNSLMILDKEPCRPFDANRAGLNLGEGAAYVVLESDEMASARGAKPLAYLCGYGNACDAFHQTASSDNGEGAFLAMSKALDMAGLSAADVDYVNAHGTGTPNNDASESNALKRVFSSSVPPFSSTKGLTGHTTSASGSIEAVFCILAMTEGVIPPNVGFSSPIEGGLTPVCTPTKAQINIAMCNAFGFGGNDSSIILSKENIGSTKPAEVPESQIREAARVVLTDADDLGELSKYIRPMETRRMGRLLKGALLASYRALETAGLEKPDAVITGTYFGCLDNSAKLMTEIHDAGEENTSPTLFMQSTHNTIGSAVAIRLKCHGYNSTYSQGLKSLDCALEDARRLLRKGEARSVLVGCYDEDSPLFARMTKEAFGDSQGLRAVAIVLQC